MKCQLSDEEKEYPCSRNCPLFWDCVHEFEKQQKKAKAALERLQGEKQGEARAMKYRKKPVIVEAYQTDHEMVIQTLEGDMVASPGDYIITGIAGEQYPCKPEIFRRTYEPVEEE